MAAVLITIGVHEQYHSPEMGGTFEGQPTKGGDVSVMTRVIVRAQKKRDFRRNELQDVNKELDDMLMMLIRRSTMDEDELRSNIHHIVRAQMAAFAPQRPPGQ